MELDISVDSANASGTLRADGREIPIEQGIVSGNQVIFKIKMGVKMTLTLEFNGSTVIGTMKPGFLPATELSGERIS